MLKIILKENEQNESKTIIGDTLVEEFISDTLFATIKDKEGNNLFIVKYDEIAVINVVDGVNEHKEIFYETGDLREFTLELNCNKNRNKILCESYSFTKVMTKDIIRAQEYLGFDEELEQHKWRLSHVMLLENIRYIDRRRSSDKVNKIIEKSEDVE